MPRKPSSTDGRPRVHLSSTISAKAHDFLVKTTARLKKTNPDAAIGQAVDSLADFAIKRRFDPIKVKKPVSPLRHGKPAQSATPSGTKG